MSAQALQLAYLVSGVLFILALRWLSAPQTARRGVLAGEVGMLVAVVATLLRSDIVSYQWIAVGLAVGSAIGIPMALFMPMTAMPQRIALSHAFGALAAALVGTAEFYLRTPRLSTFTMSASGVEVFLGFLTFTGSLMAFGKLQELLPQRPVLYRGQNLVNFALLACGLGLIAALVLDPSHTALFPFLIAIALAVGVLVVVPIGGADMPVVISLLNSYAGLSGAAMGFVLGNEVLIIAGALDGSSGFLLSLIMSRAMNRSFRNVLFGGFGQLRTTAGETEGRPVRRTTPDEAAELLRDASTVIVVPGYGMAVARAQQKVRELYDGADRAGRGGEVRDPSRRRADAGPHERPPGGGRHPLRPSVRHGRDQPRLRHRRRGAGRGSQRRDQPCRAHRSRRAPSTACPSSRSTTRRTVIVIKRSLNPGFAGIDNPLYYEDRTLMLFADAREAVASLVEELSSTTSSIG